jgi:hypothetical protein
LGELINHYLNHELPRLSKSARTGNQSYVKNWIEPAWHRRVADNMKSMQIQDWLDKVERPDGTKLKIKNILSAIFSHDIADLERRECEGRAIATSSHYSQDNLGTLCTSGFRRPAKSTQEGRPDGAGEISREIEIANRRRNCVETVLGVRGCPKSTLPKSAKCFKVLVSAAGLEPATHALKGHCSTN